MSVELLSHYASFEDKYVLVLVINGLIDTNLQMELKASHDLSWEKLKILFKARLVAMHIVDVLAENYNGIHSNNKEGVLYVITLRVAHIKHIV